MTHSDLPDDPARAVTRRAEAFAARLPERPDSFALDLPTFTRELHELLDAVRQSDPAFAFDRDGRPDAVGAIRSLLPGMERDLLDAVLEDHEAELSAWREALYQVLAALRRASGRARSDA